MAISKRMRFEILRRDNFRCYYCGATAAESDLHVDHVIPVTLGGTDIAENLVTSCADCNAGKSSTAPSEELVAKIDEAVALEAAARRIAAEELNDLMPSLDQYEDEIQEIWDRYIPSYRRKYAPGSDLATVTNWYKTGVSLAVIEHAIRVAVQADHIDWRGKPAYAAGVVRNRLLEAGNGS